jgi:hypothetical protein
MLRKGQRQISPELDSATMMSLAVPGRSTNAARWVWFVS